MKKYILGGLFICLCSIFLMSHNANAVIEQQVQFVESFSGLTWSNIVYSGTNYLNCNANCTLGMNASTDLTVVINAMTFNVPVRTYYDYQVLEYTFTMHKVSNSTSIHDFVSSWNVSDNNFKLMDVVITQQSTNAYTVKLYLKVRQTGTASYFVLAGNAVNYYLLVVQPQGRIAIGHAALWNIVGVQDQQAIINAIQNQPDYTQALNDLDNSVNDVKDSVDDLKDTIEQQQQDEEDALDDATQDAQDGADDSSQAATTATTGLISVISGFVSAVTSASPSNCQIDGDIGHLDMGTIDLCSLPVPSFVQIIGSIILILVCIPFVIIMFNRFISLFRSFQG